MIAKTGDLVRHVDYDCLGVVLADNSGYHPSKILWLDGTITCVPNNSLEVL